MLSRSHSQTHPFALKRSNLFPRAVRRSPLSAMRTTVLLLLLLYFSGEAEPTTFPGDSAALKAVVSALDPSSIPAGSCLSSWDFSFDPCSSAFGTHFTCGLRCDATSFAVDGESFSRVSDLSLDPAGYSGLLSPSIWSLPFLQSLDLSNNRLSGQIPPPGTFPPLLRSISLSRNSLSGPVPAFPLSPSLEELYLDGNGLSGQFPSLPSPSLRRLELQSNNLSGDLPDLRRLPSLAFIDASDNSLSGPFPTAALPPSLIELSMRNNRLSGSLPAAAVASLPALQVLDLSHNAFTGSVPAAAFEHPSLEQLALAGNGFEWVEDPSGVTGASRMVALDLSHNRLSGLLPEFIGSMPRLTAVALEDNLFTGLIPEQYALRATGLAGDGVPFERLLLAGNYLYGPIPELMQKIKEGSAAVSLTDNCLFRCPEILFFCAGGQQKTAATCREFDRMIP